MDSLDQTHETVHLPHCHTRLDARTYYYLSGKCNKCQTFYQAVVSVLQSTVAPVEGRLRRNVPSLPAIKPDRLKTAKTLVEKAGRLRKVFSVQGPYPVIRAALWARGWVERRLPNPTQRAPHCHGNEEEDGGDGDVSVHVTAYLHFSHFCPTFSSLAWFEMKTYFHWTTRRDYIDCRSLRNDQMINHYANSGTFTTKVGLCVNLRNLQWFDTADPDTFFPRRTACTSLLQHVVETSRRTRDQAEELDNGDLQVVGPGMVDMALHVCQEFLSVLEHGDIDSTAETPDSAKEQQWVEFLQEYYMVVHEGASIRGSGVFVERCRAMLIRLQEVCPQLDTDGLNNIWIIKPGAKSRGRGIMCMNRMEEILALVDSDRALSKESKWVIQKYLERPLLVHGTKFDLRQWFLVTDWNPLTIWFYRECYLRFSTQPYSTKTLDSSVHLCNNSIQKHFQPSCERHPGVPEDNMWSCSQFKAFLQLQGLGVEWESIVVPGMKQAVVRALQTSQDLVEPRKASFELYGADFMLGRDLRPWLLEINASPTMSCSTAVTARLCPAVQVDTLRVVLDRRTDPSAYTGGFQLIFKQAAVEVPQYVGVNLVVEGAPIRRSRSLLHRQTVISKPPPPCSSLHTSLQKRLKRHIYHQVRGKENRAAGEKKRQLTSTSPKRECEGRKDVQNTSCVRTLGRSLASQMPLVVHTEPQRKARRLGLSLGANGETLVPRSFSFSLSPPHNMSDCKSRANQGHGSHMTRSFLPQTAFDPQHRTPIRVCPSLRSPLPTLEVLSLRPNIVAGNTAYRNPNSSSHLSVHSPQLFLCSRRQSMAKFKGQCTGEHKH
ncbi:hypothetical protein F7725_017191 [Dissostichus mawsoni]|uniref:Tubulin monoglycylase TTLL3 n=1 Tax=Dissostichus mawsoni TaxID=36200 RepID=A0A7J5Z820_DISMA|nr:hypothetical protein F7725_017191 [Dissostichus mawsoni]